MNLFLILFYCIFAVSAWSDAPKGSLIVFAGISGSGKSTLTREVSKRFNAICLLEPEEEQWPEYVQKKQPYGEFGSLMTIRSVRVHSLWNAWELRKNGQLVFFDTIYDKINIHNIGKPSMEWLIDPKDPYFSIAEEVLRLDSQILPNPDMIVLIDVSYEDWVAMLKTRNREKDFIEGFQESYALARDYLFNAIQAFASDNKIPVLFFQQKHGIVDEQVDLLYRALKNTELLKKHELR